MEVCAVQLVLPQDDSAIPDLSQRWVLLVSALLGLLGFTIRSQSPGESGRHAAGGYRPKSSVEHRDWHIYYGVYHGNVRRVDLYW
jgi:hypothetical protein